MSNGEQIIDNIPQYIFGKSSYIPSQQEIGTTISESIPELLISSLIAILIAIIYLMWINHWGAQGSNHRKLFRFLGYHHGNYDSKLDIITPSFNTYIRTGNGVGIIIAWLALLTTFEYFGLEVNSIPQLGSRWTLYVGCFVGIVAIYVLQSLIIKAIGWVMREEMFATTLLYIKGISLNIFTIVVTPSILCFALSHNSVQDAMFYILLAQIAAVTIILLYESFFLFLEKKVSVLHTILYLCAVEIFPLTLIWVFSVDKL